MLYQEAVDIIINHKSSGMPDDCMVILEEYMKMYGYSEVDTFDEDCKTMGEMIDYYNHRFGIERIVYTANSLGGTMKEGVDIITRPKAISVAMMHGMAHRWDADPNKKYVISLNLWSAMDRLTIEVFRR